MLEKILTKSRDFNSRPSARGDKSSIVPLKHPQISIHAPPRGATADFLRLCRDIHFNSRPSARGDGLPWL